MATRADLREPRSPATRRGRWRSRLGIAGGVAIMTVGSVVLLLLACLTLFQARRFYAECLAKWMSRAALWCCGVTIVEHRDFSFPARQTVFISNHTSALDMFVLIALGLPRTRYFLSGFLRKIVPLGVIATLIGTFWTAPQRRPKKRTRIFQRAERILRKTGDSVFLTPEGQQIGCFNKGAFHLATNLSAPIQPILILIPAEVDPGPWQGDDQMDVRPGVVEIHYRPAIDTRDWDLAGLEQNRDAVRELYAQWKPIA